MPVCVSGLKSPLPPFVSEEFFAGVNLLPCGCYVICWSKRVLLPQDGTAPLWIASQMGHSEVVRVMLLRGAERDAARNVSLSEGCST